MARSGVNLLSVAEAQARIIALAPDLAVERIAIGTASGRWAAEPVVAKRTQPAADLSAMDGYAIRFDERPGPWRLAGESAAGGGLEHALAPGETARIFTGAPMPDGADTVLVQEDVTVADGAVTMSGEGPAAKGSHIRRRGYDFAEGAVLIEAGARINPARIGLAATGGHGDVAVRRRVRIGLLSTGDELVPIGEIATGVKLPASNATMLASLFAGPAVEVVDLGIAPDRIEAITAAINRAKGIDLLITVGGASVGDRDLVRPALDAVGATLDFWRVAVKPGKPLMAGRLGDGVVIGLPGNPVSAFVTSLIFVMPLIRAMAGAAAPLPPTRSCILDQALPANGSRAEYLRAQRKQDRVVALAQQDSAGLVALAAADSLIVRPARAREVAAGAIVEVIDIA
jgi:molybdopterin molybdotransferase